MEQLNRFGKVWPLGKTGFRAGDNQCEPNWETSCLN